MENLGESFDIHTGGIDHLSIHHPNEIAQSEGATGKQFVRFWVHYNFLTIEGEKMSKSIGNIITIEDILEQILGKPIIDEFDKYDDMRAVAALKAKKEHQNQIPEEN